MEAEILTKAIDIAKVYIIGTLVFFFMIFSKLVYLAWWAGRKEQRLKSEIEKNQADTRRAHHRINELGVDNTTINAKITDGFEKLNNKLTDIQKSVATIQGRCDEKRGKT